MFQEGFVDTEKWGTVFVLDIQHPEEAPNLSALGHEEKQAGLVRLSMPGRRRGANVMKVYGQNGWHR